MTIKILGKIIKSKLWDYLFSLILLLSSSFLAFYKLGKSSLTNWDEGIYANVVAEMGKFPNIITTCLGKVSLEKPPFGFWLHYLGTSLFGLNNFGLRAPSSLFFVASVLILYFFLKKFYSNILSFIISFSFLICPLFYFQHFIRTADLDMYFLFFTILSFYFYVSSWKKPQLIWLSGLMTGIAFMTRGYVALLILLVISCHWLWLRRREYGKKIKPLDYIFPFLLIVLPWHIYAFVFYRPEFINSYLGYHFWLRITTPLEGHNGGGLYYFSYGLKRLSVFIWLFLVAIIYSTVRFFKTKRDEDLLWILWFWLFILPLQLMETRIRWYIIGLIPSLFFLLAAVVNALLNRFKKNNIILITLFSLLFIGYFSLFLQNSIDYVLKPAILPIDILTNYLDNRPTKPDKILVYSYLEDFSGFAVDFQWIKIDKYEITWLKNASDFQQNISNNINFVLLTDSESYQEINEYMPYENSYNVINYEYSKNGWGSVYKPVMIDSRKY